MYEIWDDPPQNRQDEADSLEEARNKVAARRQGMVPPWPSLVIIRDGEVVERP